MNTTEEHEISRKGGEMAEYKKFPLPEVNEFNILTDGKNGNPPIPRSTEARNIEINQAWIPNPRLTSRAGALTWKATFLTLGQEHSTIFPEQ